MLSAQLSFRERFCIEVAPLPQTIIVFGASGDLAAKKLFPALWHLHERQLLHTQANIIGVGRSAYSHEAFRDHVRKALADVSEAALAPFLARIHYHMLNYDQDAGYTLLATLIHTLDAQSHSKGNTLFYLALPPDLYGTVVEHLAHAGLCTYAHDADAPFHNIVVEKPFGRDLASAHQLDNTLHGVLNEAQLFRIDHYLGKETVQNIFTLRFANTFFEPLLSSQWIDRVEICAFEFDGIGKRAGYYEQSGCIRDMFQNHLFALLAHMCMARPHAFTADAIRTERVKVLNAVRPWTMAPHENAWHVGQYASYRSTLGVAPDSRTETYAECALHLDNDRWRGTPFFLRSGKMLSRNESYIDLRFKPVTHDFFAPLKSGELEPNHLRIQIRPHEGLSLVIQAKKPGPKRCMGSLQLAFDYDHMFRDNSLSAYERLLLDVMLNDQTFFLRSDSIEQSWKLLDPVLAALESAPTPPTLYPDHTAPELCKKIDA